MPAESCPRKLRDGLQLLCLDEACTQERRVCTRMPGGCLNVVLNLEGGARLRLGKQTLPALPEGHGPGGYLVYLDTPECLEGVIPSVRRQRGLIITLGAAWFNASAQNALLRHDHLRLGVWRPTPRALAIAEQLLSGSASGGVSHALLVESRVLELVAEALGVWAVQADGAEARVRVSSGLHPNEYARVAKLRALIEAGEVDQCALDAIAARMGCNASTLQQHFRSAYGCSINAFRRINRLERAAHALQSEGVSVSRAAEIAGYTSQANFSTAFRRHFGLVPKHYRVRI